MTTQNKLSQDQVEAFYHDNFVECQTRHFVDLLGADAGGGRVVVDIGGGRGFFAQRLAALTSRKVRVIDIDPVSIEACRAAGVEVELGDALAPRIRGDEDVVTFNLILHHLVGPSEAATLDLQRCALAAWKGRVRAIFVNEYIYESVGGGLAGRLIFEITKSKFLSAIARAVSAFVPSLRANTFGVGVRFRTHDEWRQIFEGLGYEVSGVRLGEEEAISLPRRLLLIRHLRRDSFLLRPRP
jgi:SAM-dependent methyltransferase